jgi:uncharacterized protein (DUF2141 family)
MKLPTFIFLTLLVLPAFSQPITVEIKGIKTDKGVILLSVYRDNKTFEAETPFRVYNFSKEGMVDGKITATISDLETGTYGIALIDDTNHNGKMDYRFFMPCEGFGFSNYIFKGSRKPDFVVFSFNLDKTDLKVYIRVQYF